MYICGRRVITSSPWHYVGGLYSAFYLEKLAMINGPVCRKEKGKVYTFAVTLRLIYRGNGHLSLHQNWGLMNIF